MSKAHLTGALGAAAGAQPTPAQAKARRRPAQRRAIWTDDQVTTLQRVYANYSTEDVAHIIGHSVASTYRKANLLGLEKSAAFLASSLSGRMLPGDTTGAATRFKPGNKSWNAGRKIGTFGRTAMTQFKPGQLPPNFKAVGSERRMDGYLQRKISETGYPPRDWVAVHILLWQEHHGLVPDKHCVIFKDGNRDNIVIENLECLSRGELMKRNSLHNMPKELVELVQLRGVLTRQINKRSKNV